MSEDRLNDKFRSKVKEGNNLKTLQRAKKYFSSRGTDLIRYYHCRSNPVRNKSILKDKDLKECEVCGERLYRIDESSQYDASRELRIAQKKFMMFVDSAGEQHYTCYAISRCLDRVGISPDLDDTGIKDAEYIAPSLSDFTGPNVNLGQLPEAVREATEGTYNKVVVPFLEKWVKRAVTKKNVIRFMRDLAEVESRFLLLYLNSQQEVRLFKSKIFSILGVRYEKR